MYSIWVGHRVQKKFRGVSSALAPKKQGRKENNDGNSGHWCYCQSTAWTVTAWKVTAWTVTACKADCLWKNWTLVKTHTSVNLQAQMMNYFKLILSLGYFIVVITPFFTKLSQASKSSTSKSEFEVLWEFSCFYCFPQLDKFCLISMRGKWI